MNIKLSLEWLLCGPSSLERREGGKKKNKKKNKKNPHGPESNAEARLCFRS
jgi:hypothetical protein